MSLSSKSQRELSMQQINLQMPLIQNDNCNDDMLQSQPQPSIQLQDNLRKIVRRGGQSQYVYPTHTKNMIRNQKYSILTFIPKVLYQQFKYFFNLFYLLTALSQFIPILKVGLMFSFVAPLVLVLFLTMCKEAYEDYQRYLKDKQINSAKFMIIQHKQGEEDVLNCVKASELKVGDIIEINAGDDIPADSVILASLKQKSSFFIKTDQLDGQTDWKLRKPLFQSLQQSKNFQLSYSDLNPNIYQFQGVLTNLNEQKTGTGLENTAWRGVRVAAGRGLLMVIYTGVDTKLSLNMSQASTKFGKLDGQLNYFSKMLFLLLLGLAMMLIFLRGFSGSSRQNFVLFFKYFLLLSSIIPISMRVNLDFAKLLYKWLIDHDTNIPGALCRNSNIPQELGRVDYILSDKTGTLTQNQMLFKKFYLNQQYQFQTEDTAVIEQVLKKGLHPCQDIKSNDRQFREMQYMVTDSITALMICHNVTPVIDQDGSRDLQGSSPDQLTLVRFGQSLGFVLLERTQQLIKLRTPSGNIQEFQILEMFPFTSQSKRMSIIVKHVQTERIILYLKGADSIMQSKIPTLDESFMLQACLDLAHEGLRTLVITQKLIPGQYYLQWKRQLLNASYSMIQREGKIQQCRQKLQSNMIFLGVTGVEDKLQQGVVDTINSARSIGIKVWMLTGDKIQTAICVGRAVRLIQGREEGLFIISDVKNSQEFRDRLQKLYKFMRLSPEELKEVDKIKCVLVIDGVSLKIALNEIAQQFFQMAIRMPAIICSRVSPTQKAQIASLVIKYNKSTGRVLGIGDGGNDVALIQAAHVGVGIYGKQGIQAALASDFSIHTFSHLNDLLYWHGRLASLRSSVLAQFIIHRGVIISIMQTIFIIQFYFVPIPIYNGALLLGYSTVFTMLPVFSLVLDEDITRSVSEQFPILYKTAQQGSQVSSYTFLYWIFISFYQGAIIMVLITLMISDQSFYMITTVSFTCLIMIEFLNIFTTLHKIRTVQVVSMIVSLVLYAASMFLLKNVLNGKQLFTTSCFFITVLIVIVAWGPPFIYQYSKRWMFPSEGQKIMNKAKSLDTS